MRIVVVVILLLVTGCEQSEESIGKGGALAETRGPVVYTVNYPLAWMAQRLAGDDARVVFPAPADVDPAFWQPDIDTILQYQQADRVLLNGANYAKWIAHASLPASRLIDTSAEYSDQLITMDSGPVHSHGPKGDHSHGELAFTTWLDLDLAQQQLQAVAEALQQLMPAESTAIEQRLIASQQELKEIDARLSEFASDRNNAPLLYSHPVYQYLQRRYQLNGRALHWEPGETPDKKQWSALEKLLESHPARLMLWESQPLTAVEDRLNTLGVKSAVYAPLANRPRQGDFISGMSSNAASLKAQTN